MFVPLLVPLIWPPSADLLLWSPSSGLLVLVTPSGALPCDSGTRPQESAGPCPLQTPPEPTASDPPPIQAPHTTPTPRAAVANMIMFLCIHIYIYRCACLRYCPCICHLGFETTKGGPRNVYKDSRATRRLTQFAIGRLGSLVSLITTRPLCDLDALLDSGFQCRVQLFGLFLKSVPIWGLAVVVCLDIYNYTLPHACLCIMF